MKNSTHSNYKNENAENQILQQYAKISIFEGKE